MSTSALIIGESGSGKSSSIRNIDPAQALLIQPVKKPLPFKSSGWSCFDREKNKTGNIVLTDEADYICSLIHKTAKPIVIVDDWQYILANEFMQRAHERGFDKFTEIGRHAWDVINAANNAAEGKRVYILAHSVSDELGNVKTKTIGKLLDEKITVEGMFTIVMRALVRDGNYLFSTRNSGADTVKTPMGMFADPLIDNDLAAVDAAICDYYGITTQA